MDLQRARQLLARRDDELLDLIERLDRDSNAYQGASGRQDPRFKYRAGILVCLTIDGEGARNMSVVFPRNISVSGISVIRRGFVYPGWETQLVLRRNANTPLVVKGIVRSCRHLRGQLHEVGIQLTEKLDPRMFCEPGAIREVMAAMQRQRPLPELRGKALAISNTKEEQRELRAMLADTGLDVTACGCVGDAIDLLKSHQYDAIISDGELNEIQPEELLPKLREGGHDNAVIVLAWPDPEECVNLYAADKKTAFLQRPLDLFSLADMLEDILGQKKPGKNGAQADAA